MAHPPAPASSLDTTPTPAPVRVDWQVAVACAAALTLLFAAQSINVLGARQSWPRRLEAQALGWGLWLALTPLVFSIAALAHTRPLRSLRNIGFQIAAAFAVPVLHGVGVATARWFLGTANIHNFGLYANVVVALSIQGDFLRYLLIAAVYHALAYSAELRRRAVSDSQMAQRLAEARLERLEARLQPHFLFNALNAIAALIRKDPPAAAAMVGQLSDLLRAALDHETTREVSLAAELRLLDQYVAIQRARFSDRLSFFVDADPDALGGYLPQMLLQPLVENAIHHGIGPREAAGVVRLHAHRDASTLRLIVEDDGVGFGAAPASLKGNGIGLRSTRERLTHFYGDAFDFDIRAAAERGTIVTIQLPFHTVS
jgi:hypothetical protein